MRWNNQSQSNQEITVVQLESTDVCQAECPLCPRETDKNFDKNKRHHLTVSQVSGLFSEAFVKNLEKMFICGNYGDPAAGQHTLELFQWFRDLNPCITLGMHSNGGLRPTTWWEELAGIMNLNNDYVVFSIDGLEDTNHLYRVNVDWNKLKQNCQAFISAGGQAHWDMLIYEHNQHQVEQCQQLAKDMGFTWFRAKVSKRPLRNNLRYPVNWQKPLIIKSNEIKCHALQEKSLYVNSRGKISPCCWLGLTQQDLEYDFEKIQSSWKTTSPEPVCMESCSVTKSGTTFSDQWKIEIALNQTK